MRNNVVTVAIFGIMMGLFVAPASADKPDFDCAQMPNEQSCESGKAKDGCMRVEDGDDSFCTDLAVCGDGVVQYGEECDGGADCTEECTLQVLCEVPEEGTEGADATSGDGYVVCRADETSAWVSSDQSGGGVYEALNICNSLGYTSLLDRGGTCGTVCGYCGTPGNELYDGAGYAGDNEIRFTVHWLCGDLAMCM